MVQICIPYPVHAIIFLHTIASLVYNVVRIPPFVVKVSPNWNLKSRFRYRKGLSFLCSSKFNQMNLYMSHIHLSVGFIQKYICLFKNAFLIQLFFKSSCQKSILFSWSLWDIYCFLGEMALISIQRDWTAKSIYFLFYFRRRWLVLSSLLENFLYSSRKWN